MSPWAPVLAALTLAPLVERLDNGLTVVVLEDHRAPIVATSLRLPVGSADDGPWPGRAHLLEHLVFEGSANFPDQGYDRLLAAAGGAADAWTSPDWTVLGAVASPGALPGMLAAEADRLATLPRGLDAHDLPNQVAVVQAELLATQTRDQARGRAAVLASTWPADHPYHRPPAGTPQGVQSLALEPVLALWRERYRPAGAVLTVVGDVAAHEVLEAVRAGFGPLSGAPPPARGPAGDRLPPGRRHTVADLAEARLYLAFPAPPEGPESPACELLARLFRAGGGAGLDSLRDLPAQVGAWCWQGRLGGELVVWASSPVSPRELLPRARRALRRAARPTADELDRARADLLLELAALTEDPAALAEALGHCQAVWGRADCLADRARALLALDAAALRRVARASLRRPTVVSVVPPAGALLPRRSRPLERSP